MKMMEGAAECAGDDEWSKRGRSNVRTTAEKFAAGRPRPAARTSPSSWTTPPFSRACGRGASPLVWTRSPRQLPP